MQVEERGGGESERGGVFFPGKPSRPAKGPEVTGEKKGNTQRNAPVKKSVSLKAKSPVFCRKKRRKRIERNDRQGKKNSSKKCSLEKKKPRLLSEKKEERGKKRSGRGEKPTAFKVGPGGGGEHEI